MSIKWQESLTGLRLDLLSRNRSDSTITNRTCTTRVMARHATAPGLDPADVSYEWLADYLVRQSQARKGGGPASCYAANRPYGSGRLLGHGQHPLALLSYVLDHIGDGVVLTGTTNPAHLRQTHEIFEGLAHD